METFVPRGVCSRKIYFEVENDTITHCEFVGGCAGNTQGVAKLVIFLLPMLIAPSIVPPALGNIRLA
jgi:uncharacterized protein (TIGR03905 family)